MPELAFSVLGAEPLRHSAAPAVRFDVRVDNAGPEPVRSLLLDTQVRIAVRMRGYDGDDHDRLFELFGPEEAWGASLQSLLWTRTTRAVPGFEQTTVVEMEAPCSYDVEATASRYLGALRGGDVPLEFLFSGSVFYAGPDGRLQTERLTWNTEARHRLPVEVWQETMRRHFGDAAWLSVGRETFDRLSAYRSRNALASWDEALDSLMEATWTR